MKKHLPRFLCQLYLKNIITRKFIKLHFLLSRSISRSFLGFYLNLPVSAVGVLLFLTNSAINTPQELVHGIREIFIFCIDFKKKQTMKTFRCKIVLHLLFLCLFVFVLKFARAIPQELNRKSIKLQFPFNLYRIVQEQPIYDGRVIKIKKGKFIILKKRWKMNFRIKGCHSSNKSLLYLSVFRLPSVTNILCFSGFQQQLVRKKE